YGTDDIELEVISIVVGGTDLVYSTSVESPAIKELTED
ncbi:unnamed protein product, partial [Rotaria sordida]